MAKINLGKAPANFKRDVVIPMLDGSTDMLKITYKYRTRSEYAKMMDEVIFAAKDKAESAPQDKQGTFQEMISEQDDFSVNYVLEIAEGWDLSDAFNQENLQKLRDMYPGAIDAIINTYREAILEGRLKN